MAAISKDIIGKRFGHLTVIKEVGINEKRYILILSKCDCGNERVSTKFQVTSGRLRTCGCMTFRAEMLFGRKEFPSKHILYPTWHAMIARCYVATNDKYKDYGGRGIKVCLRWRKSFYNFLEDMGNRPSKEHSLERIKNNKGYCPSNCKWATTEEQAANKRNNVQITYNGRTLTIAQWSKITGMGQSRLSNRIKKGYPPELLFSKEDFKGRKPMKKLIAEFASNLD